MTGKKYLADFLRLTEIMATRQGIVAHPREYYQKMLETFPAEMVQLYAAEFQGQIFGCQPDEISVNRLFRYFFQFKQREHIVELGQT